MSDPLGRQLEDHFSIISTSSNTSRRRNSKSSTNKKKEEKNGKRRSSSSSSLQRVACQVSTPLAKFLQTLEHVQRHMDNISESGSGVGVGVDGRRRRSSSVAATTTNNLEDTTSLELRVATVLADNGPWLLPLDREEVWKITKQVAGRNRYFGYEGSNNGNVLCQWASILHQRRFGISLEIQTTKLYYPFNCPILRMQQQQQQQDTTTKQLINPMEALPEYQRGKRHIVVVGLSQHGKSALCGRMIQAFGQSSPLAISKVTSAAKRAELALALPSSSDNSNNNKKTKNKKTTVPDAVWLSDRNKQERITGTTWGSKSLPLYHTSIGSFMIVDTPTFVEDGPLQPSSRVNDDDDYIVNNNNNNNAAPKVETRRRSVLNFLSFYNPELIVICVAIDMDWEDTTETKYLWNLVRQVRAASGASTTSSSSPQQQQQQQQQQNSRLVFVVTKMDKVEWSQERYDFTVKRIRYLIGDSSNNVQIIPSSAAEPAPGIVHPVSWATTTTTAATASAWAHNKEDWNHISLLSIAQETFSKTPILEQQQQQPMSSPTTASTTTTTTTGRGEAVITKYVRNVEEIVLVLVIVIRGRIAVGDEILSENENIPAFRVESIQWFGHPCSMAYEGQQVGLKLRKLLSTGYHHSEYYHSHALIEITKRRLITFITKGDDEILSTKGGQQEQEQQSQHVNNVAAVELSLSIDSQIVSGHKEESGKRRPQIVAYPSQVGLRISDMSIVGESNGGASVLVKIKVDNENAKTFFLGQRLVLYLTQGSKEMCGFGHVTMVAGESLGDERMYLNWLSRELIPPQSKEPTPFTTTTRHPIPKPHRLCHRNVSELSMSLSSLGGIDENKLNSGPANSINEALRQTDAAIKAMMRLRDELEKLKMAQQEEGSVTDTCYMCMCQCPKSPKANVVPICENCTALNKAKRSANLGLDRLVGHGGSGGDDDVGNSITFVITGARIKIGYATVRRILLDDSVESKKKILVLTTRFPHLLAEKLFQDLPEKVKDATVHIYGSDFRSVPSVLSLGKHLSKYYPKVFALINNAAQTVRRPPAFYASIVERELQLAQNPGSFSRMVKVVGTDPFEETPASPVLDDALIRQFKTTDSSGVAVVQSLQECETFPLVASALMTQCQVLKGDFASYEAGDQVFPVSSDGIDPNTGENVCDLRTNISWRKSLLPNPKQTEETVEPVEFLEVLLVNTLAPYILLKSLVNSLKAATGNVVNVSSREGVFARVKFSEHPHTNSAKAGLNMLTKTTSYELKQINVMICSVDTGWVSKYYQKSGLHPDGTSKGMIPPLTTDDAAARILDPIAQRLKNACEGKGLRTGCHYRDFKATVFL